MVLKHLDFRCLMNWGARSTLRSRSDLWVKMIYLFKCMRKTLWCFLNPAAIDIPFWILLLLLFKIAWENEMNKEIFYAAKWNAYHRAQFMLIIVMIWKYADVCHSKKPKFIFFFINRKEKLSSLKIECLRRNIMYCPKRKAGWSLLDERYKLACQTFQQCTQRHQKQESAQYASNGYEVQ